ncbi:MAG: hypothetical protein L0099_04560 [Acidobacteria bacterium]|nr:hypothetical protein [Acidobacteriota bacterium]
MLRVTVELVPFGEEAQKRKIAEAVIYNDGTGTPLVGNYVAGFCESGWIGSVEIHGHERRQTVWALVHAALTKLLKGK